MSHSKLIVAVIAATATLAVAVGLASANRLTINERITTSKFNSMEFIGGIATVRCLVTLEGTFHSFTTSKVAEALVGYVTKASIANCGGGRARVNTETLPWHQRYLGFSGELPRITRVSLRVVNSSFSIEAAAIPGISCRYTAPSVTTTSERETGTGKLTSTAFEGSGITSETFGCPSGSVAATGTPTTFAGGNLVVTLVQ